MTDPSNQILEANLSRLPPAVERALRAATAQPSISLQMADSLLKASVKTDDGRWVPVHPSEDPIAASERVAARFSDKQPPLIIVVGLGLGYLLDALEKRGSTTRVLAIEPIPAITRAMLSRRDWTNWLESGRLTILAGPDYNGSAEVWGLFGQGAPTPPTIMAPLLEREFGDAATRATALVRQIIAGAKANEEARRQFAGRYLMNTLTNLPTIATEGDVSALFGAFPRVPAVVVGAGPSLDKNLKDLAKLEGKVLIIAVDTAVRPLLAAGIRPHLVVAVDPSDLNALHLRDLPDCRGLWFVAEGSVDSSVFPQFAGRTFTFKVSNHHPWPWIAEQSAGRGGLRAWGSVLTTAFDLACHVGCDPIIFAGADLAYTDGLQYCRNTVYEDKWRDFPTDAERAEVFKAYLADRAHFPHPDVRGGEALTTPHFIQFRDWIVSRAGEAADRRIVNATGGGILHGGRIAQTDFSVLHLPKSKHDLGLERRLAAAWGAGAEIRRQSLAALPSSLSHRDALPMATWLEFGGDTTTPAQIETALASAQSALTHAAATTAYLANRCANDDTRSRVDEGVDALQAQVLLDFLDRSHARRAHAHTKDVVRASGQLLTGLRVLDVSCGVGLTMAPLASAGLQVDGVDISQRVLDAARQHSALATSQFFLSDGDDCGSAPDGHYDLAYAHDALHLIASRTVRRRLLRAIGRALRPGGMFIARMPFYADRDGSAVPAPHVTWQADVTDGIVDGAIVAAINPTGHVWATRDALPAMLADFSEHFRDVRFQLIDISQDVASDSRSSNDGSATRSSILVSGTAAGGLATRVDAPLPHTEHRQPTANVVVSSGTTHK